MKAGALALALWIALAPLAAPAADPPPPTRRELVRSLLSEKGCLVLVSAAEFAADAGRRERLAEDLARTVRGPVRVATDAGEAAAAPALPLVLVGESPELRRLAPRLPLPLGSEDGARVALLAPHPESPDRPLLVVHGPGAAATAGRALREVVFGEVDFTIARRGRTVRSGRFVPGEGRVDPASEYDVARRAAEYAAGLAPSGVSTPLVRVFAPFDASPFRAAVAEKERRLRASNWTAPVDLFLYESAEAKAAVTLSAAPCDAEPLANGGTRVHAVAFAPAAEWANAEAEWLASGLPEESALADTLRAAIPYVTAGTYRGEDLAVVERRLRAQGRLLPLADLVDDERYGRHSYLFAEPSAASFVRFLRARGTKPPPGDAAADERAWHESLGPGPSGAPDPPRPVEFQRGVCLAHTYDIHTGYLSAGAKETVRQLRDEASVRWISISPFGYPRAKDRPAIEPRDLGSPAAVSLRAENDESLVAMTRSAHDLGVKVAVVPHLWAHDFWCGEIAMTNEADWSAFFDNYGRFILHHAEVARRAGADLFCVGKELGGTTRAKPGAWRALVADVRRVFPGPVTYAANWGDEFETLAFFDACDLAGLNLYQPLADGDAAPDDATLRAAAEKAAARAEAVARRTGRPVALMEVGLPAHPLAAREPWKDPPDDRLDEGLQARAYRAIMTAFHDRPWCAGLYWWKVFTDPRANARRRNGFPPVGRPAESVLREFYAGESRRGRDVAAPR